MGQVGRQRARERARRAARAAGRPLGAALVAAALALALILLGPPGGDAGGAHVPDRGLARARLAALGQLLVRGPLRAGQLQPALLPARRAARDAHRGRGLVRRGGRRLRRAAAPALGRDRDRPGRRLRAAGAAGGGGGHLPVPARPGDRARLAGRPGGRPSRPGPARRAGDRRGAPAGAGVPAGGAAGGRAHHPGLVAQPRQPGRSPPAPSPSPDCRRCCCGASRRPTRTTPSIPRTRSRSPASAWPACC